MLIVRTKNIVFYVGELDENRVLRPNELPENTIFGVKQAKYIHYDNKHMKGKNYRICGSFVIQLKVIGQIQPGHQNISPEVVSESTEIAAREDYQKVSNPGYSVDGVKRKFEPNFASDIAVFSTLADSQPRSFYDFGVEKVEDKKPRQSFGRRKFNLLAECFFYKN